MENKELLDQARTLYSDSSFVRLELIPKIEALLDKLTRIAEAAESTLHKAIAADQNGNNRNQIVLCKTILEIVKEDHEARSAN